MGQRFREKDMSLAEMERILACMWRRHNIPRYIGREGYTTDKNWFWKNGIEYTPASRRERRLHGHW